MAICSSGVPSVAFIDHGILELLSDSGLGDLLFDWFHTLPLDRYQKVVLLLLLGCLSFLLESSVCIHSKTIIVLGCFFLGGGE